MDLHITSDIWRLLRRGVVARPHALFPGAVAQVAIHGEVLPPVVVGDAVHWADPERELPPDQRVPMQVDTLFDIASLTKLFTAVAALRVLPRYGIRLDDPLGDVLDEYGSPKRRTITWRHLLTHTAGLPATYDVWHLDLSPAARRARLLEAELEHPPGSQHVYSCVGYITAGIAMERLTGMPLDRVVAQEVMYPLGLADTSFLPGPEKVPRTAATEFTLSAGGGMLRGEVHDETAWSIGGVSGNAGLFSTAADLITLGLALSQPERSGLLASDQWRLATTDQRPWGPAGEYGQAIGMRVGDPGLMPGHGHWCGHTGFTGTSVVVEPGTGTVGVLLTNRVHPSRCWSDLGETRRELTAILAGAPQYA